MDDKQEKPPLPRDEQKKRTRTVSDRQEAIWCAEQLLGGLLNHPTSWAADDMTMIRQIITTIGHSPVTFPPAQLDSPLQSPIEMLTKDFGNKLYDRDELPLSFVLQITASSQKKNNLTLGNKIQAPYRQWTFEGRDGDDCIITIKLDSTLHSQGNRLQKGAIIKVDNFFPVYFHYNDKSDSRCAIVLKQFSVVGSFPVEDKFLGRPPQRKKVKVKASNKDGEAHSENDTDDDADNRPCGGEQCSKYGVSFENCIVTCIPIDDVALQIVADECVFARKDNIEEMEPKEKRFLFYYYYATSVYQFHGSGNRVDLPKCLLTAIRNAFPEPTGIYSTRA